MRQQDEDKQGILKILNLEDQGPICAFAIERSRGAFSVPASGLDNSVLARAGYGCSIKFLHQPARMTGVHYVRSERRQVEV